MRQNSTELNRLNKQEYFLCPIIVVTFAYKFHTLNVSIIME